jgi:hypothetical protein
MSAHLIVHSILALTSGVCNLNKSVGSQGNQAERTCDIYGRSQVARKVGGRKTHVGMRESDCERGDETSLHEHAGMTCIVHACLTHMSKLWPLTYACQRNTRFSYAALAASCDGTLKSAK